MPSLPALPLFIVTAYDVDAFTLAEHTVSATDQNAAHDIADYLFAALADVAHITVTETTPEND